MGKKEKKKEEKKGVPKERVDPRTRVHGPQRCDHRFRLGVGYKAGKPSIEKFTKRVAGAEQDA